MSAGPAGPGGEPPAEPRGGQPGGRPGGPDSDGEAKALEYGRWLFAQECVFVSGAASEEGLPPPVLEEIGFAGRSNVGKSSLLNALAGRKTLARISHTPGRTQQLNFFQLGDRLMLVDLPGYGYARAPKDKIRLWNQLIHAYLSGRPNLRRLCLLIDSRHGLKDADREIMKILDRDAVSYQIVLTKADKSKAEELVRRTAALADELRGHPASHPEIFVTSARTGDGIAALRATLAALAPPERFG